MCCTFLIGLCLPATWEQCLASRANKTTMFFRSEWLTQSAAAGWQLDMELQLQKVKKKL